MKPQKAFESLVDRIKRVWFTILFRISVVRNLRAKNPDYGCLRIAQTVNELLGISISEQTVRRILREHRPPGSSKPIGPSWLTYFADTKDSLWSIDLFRVESINLKTHWVLAVINVYSRKIVGYAVHAGNGVSGENLCYMFNRVLGSSGSVPKRISRDRDPLFQFEQWKRNIDILGVEELYGPPHTPTANPFVERLIGTTRREFLDKTFFWSEQDLKKKLSSFQNYYNEHRVHSGIEGQKPEKKYKSVVSNPDVGKKITWKKVCNGHYQIPIAT